MTRINSGGLSVVNFDLPLDGGFATDRAMKKDESVATGLSPKLNKTLLSPKNKNIETEQKLKIAALQKEKL